MRKTNDRLGRDERWNTKEEQAAHDEFWAKVKEDAAAHLAAVAAFKVDFLFTV